MDLEDRNLKGSIGGSGGTASSAPEKKNEDNAYIAKDEANSSGISTVSENVEVESRRSSASIDQEEEGKRVKRRIDKDDHIRKDSYSHKKDDQNVKKEDISLKSKNPFGNVGSLKTNVASVTTMSTFEVTNATTSGTASMTVTNPTTSTLSVVTTAVAANTSSMMVPTTTQCDSSENDDPFRCGVDSPGPKVPPLKIVIPSGEAGEQGNRNGKMVTRQHGGLPYIVVPSDETGAVSLTSPNSPNIMNTIRDDDSSITSSTANLSNEEQRIQQRVLRSTNSHKISLNSSNGNNNGDDSAASNTSSSNTDATRHSSNGDNNSILAGSSTNINNNNNSSTTSMSKCDASGMGVGGNGSSSSNSSLSTASNSGVNYNSGSNNVMNNPNNVDNGSNLGNNNGSRAAICNSSSSTSATNATTFANTTSTSSITSTNNSSGGGSGSSSNNNSSAASNITTHSNLTTGRTNNSGECSSGSNSSETSGNSSPATMEMSPSGDTFMSSATLSSNKEDGNDGGGSVKSKTESNSAKSGSTKTEAGGNSGTTKMKPELHSSSSNNSKTKSDLEDDSNKGSTNSDTRCAITSSATSFVTSITDTQNKEATVPVVELHPRKRKLKSKQEINHTTTELDHSISFGSAPHPHEVPVTNCYQMFMDIRRQIDVKRKGLFPIQPKPPQGFKDYLMNRCTYTLAGNSIPRLKRRNAEPPEGIDDRLKDLYQEQEAERYSLRMQHVVEKEKLVLSVEQEILRVHGRAARALANQALPFSACTILKDEEVYNVITPEQEEKDRNARSRYNGRLFISWLQDVDDKWEKIKEEMLARHHKEAESLNAVQKFNWDLKMRLLGLWKKKNTVPIDESHVPMISVSDDFDLLPE
ncbi:ankyrin repeat domain-containing protein 12 [Planococcus citri]|uniref:ankyrin repeat domain-containing protein 12 n=1 Tax=Planococcus citri TaxID=170843 RepID=UPI0031F7317C